MLIHNFPAHALKEYVSLQNIGTAFCPCKIRHESSVRKDLESLGYPLLDRWDIPYMVCGLPLSSQEQSPPYMGMFFKNRHLDSSECYFKGKIFKFYALLFIFIPEQLKLILCTPTKQFSYDPSLLTRLWTNIRICFIILLTGYFNYTGL